MKNWQKIAMWIVIVIVLIAIASIWFYKTVKEDEPVAESKSGTGTLTTNDIHRNEMQTDTIDRSTSRIRDMDMSVIQAARSNILRQASAAMLSQANSLPPSVLSTLG